MLVQPESTAILRGLIVASYVAVGVYTWWLRPTSRLGPLVAGVGFLFAAASLMASATPSVYSLGRVLLGAFVVYLMYVLLCFPRDRLGSELERRFIAAATVASLVAWAIAVALSETLPSAGVLVQCDGPCPTNAFQLVGASAAVERAIEPVIVWLTLLVFIGAAALLVRKLQAPSRLRRRAIAPLLYTFVAFVIILMIQVLFVRVLHVEAAATPSGYWSPWPGSRFPPASSRARCVDASSSRRASGWSRLGRAPSRSTPRVCRASSAKRWEIQG